MTKNRLTRIILSGNPAIAFQPPICRLADLTPGLQFEIFPPTPNKSLQPTSASPAKHSRLASDGLTKTSFKGSTRRTAIPTPCTPVNPAAHPSQIVSQYLSSLNTSNKHYYHEGKHRQLTITHEAWIDGRNRIRTCIRSFALVALIYLGIQPIQHACNANVRLGILYSDMPSIPFHLAHPSITPTPIQP